MSFIQSIILAVLVALSSALLGISSEKEQAFLYEQFEQLLFGVEIIEEQDGIIVTRVVDGDTIVINNDGVEQKVRLIGIDTPETVDPRKEVECFGKEASQKMESLVLGQVVELEADPSQEDEDRFGRLLRYVYLENGLHINLELVLQGYAHEYTYNIPYRYQAEFMEAEKTARNLQRGLWGDSCNFVENQ